MPGNAVLKRMLDAGAQFTEMSQTTAEKLVNEFVRNGHVRRKDAEKTVKQLVDRGRSSTEHVLAAIQSEVAKQLGRFADRVDNIEDRIEDLADQLGVRTKKPAAPVPAKKAPVKKAAAKKAVAKKAAAKKAPAKKVPAGSSGVAKLTTKKAAKR
jgi:polyhydroxyalkanoate synthesis regulator phasin